MSNISKYVNFNITDDVFLVFIRNFGGRECYFGGHEPRATTSSTNFNNCPVFVTTAELLTGPHCKTIQKEIKSAKDGKIIRIGRQSRNSDRCVQKLNTETKQQLIMMKEVHDKLSEVREEIYKCVPQELKDREKELEKLIKKETKNIIIDTAGLRI